MLPETIPSNRMNSRPPAAVYGSIASRTETSVRTRQQSQHERKQTQQNRFGHDARVQLPSRSAQHAAHGHLAGSETGLGYRQVDIVDDGENEDQQSDDRQNQDELLIASVLKMETVEENILHRPEYRFFIVRESVVAGFLDTLPDRFGFGRQVGVPARHQEQFP